MPDPIKCEHGEAWRRGYTIWKTQGVLGEIAFELGILVSSEPTVDKNTIDLVMNIVDRISKSL